MQDGSKVSKALGGAIDVLAVTHDDAGLQDKPAADHRPYAELPERGGKWARPVRVAVIAGSAAALWGLIFLGIRVL